MAQSPHGGNTAQYICSYCSYLEAVSSIRNLRKRHAVETWDPLNMDNDLYNILLIGLLLFSTRPQIFSRIHLLLGRTKLSLTSSATA
jgi:hypothetical protein